ncbi:hydrogenase expression/formation protein HypE [Pseudonocardia alaniniphila]|uniref:Hydrogenase expression/formation protein HypE n=1 Tax=Pseudonocardia alaniniphila TaxID=75291 RepID=A0ABS9T7M5_9PSEU|nr:hydrogenase expression/formation protein HypE [Pseudonocardia alaniniphila]MCH6164535.1 hydrogenase expression/formation protein HypE [Pseudonocardia alaniniphila]
MTQDLGPGIDRAGATRANWAEEAVAAAAADEAQLAHAETQHPHAGSEHLTREEQVLARIAKARARKARIKEERITLAHGAGGKATQTLIEAVFLDAFRNPVLEKLEDGAQLAPTWTNGVTGRLAFTTDSYVVSPLFFPGGDIGDLAVNGTVNDLAMCGARPLFLSCGFILEEGFPVADLQRIVASMAAAAQAAGVQIVTGDTKVVERGKADGLYINTAGVGVLERDVVLSAAAARPGDVVLVSGPIGDHGITVMLARGELDISADIVSDTAPLHEISAGLLDAAGDGVRLLRDATRGGVATICNEVATAAQVAVVLDEASLPVRPVVNGASELLGIDPLYVACEGRLIAVVAPDRADSALAALRAHPLGEGAAAIGTIKDDPGLVLLRTAFGGTRIVDLLVGDPLPRIC